jgi:hypothetical protein
MSANEAERIIEGLQVFSLQEVGTQKWVSQDQAVQRLNLQVSAWVEGNLFSHPMQTS